VKDGGCLAINQFTSALLREDIEVKVISICTRKHPFRKKSFPQEYLKATGFEAIFVDTRPNPVDAFSNLITQDAYHVSRFFSSDLDKLLQERLKGSDFDFVICESIFVAPYIPTIRTFTKAQVILRSHNLEFSIWHRLVKSYKSGIKKTYLKILTRQLKNYEVDLLTDIDGLIAINSDELKHYRRLGYTGKGITIPFAVEPEDYTPNHKKLEQASIFHLGSMDWQPNLEGIEWFLKKVWPLVIKENKEVQLYLAGRNMPKELLALKMPQVTIVGEVEDAKEFIRSKNIMIIPLLSGGGMRVKLIEALALEKPVVSTPLGANGVAVKDGREVLITNQPRLFAKNILKLLKDDKEAHKMGVLGRELVLKSYDQNKLASKLHNFLKKMKE
jgi:glycosyltransferase involved in cell wall biosynthesis